MPSAHRLRRYRTLCGLPNELLYQIVSELVALGWRPSYVLKPCSLVCQCLRPICQELLFKHSRRLRIHEKESFQSVLSLFEAQPRLARPVVTLHLSGYLACRTKSCPWPTITPNFLLRIIRCLPHLQYLNLRDVRVDDDDEAHLTASTTLPADNDGRISLKWLSFDTIQNNHSSLTAIFRIISFFELGELEYHHSFDLKTAPHSGVLPILHVRHVQNRWFWRKPCLVPFIRSLTLYLSPSHLQNIEIELVDFESIRAFGDLLSGPARNIKTLNICRHPPPLTEDRQSWKDPLDAHWPLLRLSACTKLEALYLHVYMRPKTAEVPLCATPAALMSEVSSSLKTVTIYVDCCPIKQPRALSNNRLMKLQAVDKVLSAAGQFPCFELLKLCLHLGTYLDRDKCVAACVKALPRVFATGRLKIERSA